jgi:hypothetical protein
VDRDVKGHAQQEDKAAYIHVVAEDVVDVGAADAAVSEQSGEIFDPVIRQPEHRMTRHGRHRQLACRRQGTEYEVFCLAGGALN